MNINDFRESIVENFTDRCRSSNRLNDSIILPYRSRMETGVRVVGTSMERSVVSPKCQEISSGLRWGRKSERNHRRRQLVISLSVTTDDRVIFG